MTLSSLHDVLVDQLQDLHSAESQLVKALPKIAKHVSSASLREAIESHLEETRGHVSRLEKAGQLLSCKVTGKKCHAMEGLLAEGDEALGMKGDASLIDAAVVAAAQRVEHYEIAAYGSARAMCEQLGLSEVAELLQDTLDEEKTADEKLTEVVESDIYPKALEPQEAAQAEDGNGRSRRTGSRAKQTART